MGRRGLEFGIVKMVGIWVRVIEREIKGVLGVYVGVIYEFMVEGWVSYYVKGEIIWNLLESSY